MTIYRRPDPIPLPQLVETPSSGLKPVRMPSDDLSALAARRIFMAIIGGAWSEADYLPKEDKLGEELGVSRTVVREAIKTLSAKSIVEPRRRRGTAILDPTLWNMVDSDVISWMSNGDRSSDVGDQLIEVLALTQPQVAGKVAELNLADADLKALAGRIKSADPDDLPDAVLDFHLHLAALAGNSFLFCLAQRSIEGLRTHHREQLVRHLQRTTPDQYIEAIEAIVDLDPRAAQRAVFALFDHRMARQHHMSDQH
ncbi:FadR/GntR family transcriptional regulator [Tropicimonas sp. IMCC34011]|uniref:FadR/GntR family transcriptional regulator n=1 Tax=Tropicimonas sp. IMCC34011 TaxID=2248759 RepID=UPI000E2453B1|nr:GntR family transcriptional regulator [Tropicimonas sp. IMCC34011]